MTAHIDEPRGKLVRERVQQAEVLVALAQSLHICFHPPGQARPAGERTPKSGE